MIELKPAINEVKLTLKSISRSVNMGTVVEPSGGSGVPTNVREAIYTLLDNAAYATTGLEDEIAIVQAWAQEVTALSLDVTTLTLNNDTPQTITATVVPSGSTITWTSSDNSVATVVGGVVTGVSNGSCVITATAGNKSANCAVTVSGFATLESISAVYTQSGTVLVTTPLDDLKADLVVTGTYSDTTTATIPSDAYTLSGTLEVGTSTVTVTCQGKTTTFTVTVTDAGYEFTSSSDGVGFGSVDVTKPSMSPPYVANTQARRLHIINNNSVGYPVEGGKTYEVSISNPSAQQIYVDIFNTVAQANLQNRQAVSSGDYTESSWTGFTNGKYTFTTPSSINGYDVACVWFVFRKDTSNTLWNSIGSVEMFPITFKEVAPTT